jgi:hypothetical protein
MIELTPDEKSLLSLLPAEGSSIGNGKARQILAWPDDRYDQAKAGLLAKRIAVPGRGRGGSLARAPKDVEASVVSEPEADFALSAPEPTPVKAKKIKTTKKTSQGTEKYQHPREQEPAAPRDRRASPLQEAQGTRQLPLR